MWYHGPVLRIPVTQTFKILGKRRQSKENKEKNINSNSIRIQSSDW